MMYHSLLQLLNNIFMIEINLDIDMIQIKHFWMTDMKQEVSHLSSASSTDVVATIKACSHILKGFKRYALALYLPFMILFVLATPTVFAHLSLGVGFSHTDLALLKYKQAMHQYPYNVTGYSIQYGLLLVSVILRALYYGSIFAMAQNWIQKREKKWFNIAPASKIIYLFKYILALLLYVLAMFLLFLVLIFLVLATSTIAKLTTVYLTVVPLVILLLGILAIIIAIPSYYPILIGINRGEKIVSSIKLWWNNKWAFFQLFLNILVLGAVSIATIGIALIWLQPLISLTCVQTYNNCLEDNIT